MHSLSFQILDRPRRLIVGLWLACVVAVLAIWHDTSLHMAGLWLERDIYAYGLAVPFLFAFLFWQRLPRLSHDALKPNLLGLILLVGSGVLWTGAHIAEARLGEHAALYLALVFSFTAIAGRRSLWQMREAFGFAVLLIPVGQALVAPLQIITAHFVVSLLKAANMLIDVDGVRITLSSGVYEVAEACSGARFFLASGMLGVFLALAIMKSWPRRLAFMAICFLLPVFVNALRVLLILLLAEASGQATAIGADHIIYGWGFLSFILVLVVVLAFAMREDGFDAESVREAEDQRAALKAKVTAVKVPALRAEGVNSDAEEHDDESEVDAHTIKADTKPDIPAQTPFRQPALLGMTHAYSAFGVLVVPVVAFIFGTQARIGTQPAWAGCLPEAMQTPPSVAAFRQLDHLPHVMWPKFKTADAVLRGVYRTGPERVYLTAAAYDTQSGEKGILADWRDPAGKGWSHLVGSMADTFDVNGRSFSQKLYALRGVESESSSAGHVAGTLPNGVSVLERRLVWEIRWTDGKVVNHDLSLKFRRALAKLSARPASGLTVRIMTDISEADMYRLEEAQARLEAFAQGLEPFVKALENSQWVGGESLCVA